MKALFLLTPKIESLQEVQSLLKLSEFKMVKPCDTTWLSHECFVWNINQDLLALIITLQQLYMSGDAEAYGLITLLYTYTGVVSVILLSEVLDIHTRMNASMQRKLADFSELSVFQKVMTDQVEHRRKKKCEWLSSEESKKYMLKEKHDIIHLALISHGSTRSRWSSVSPIAIYWTL